MCDAGSSISRLRRSPRNAFTMRETNDISDCSQNPDFTAPNAKSPPPHCDRQPSVIDAMKLFWCAALAAGALSVQSFSGAAAGALLFPAAQNRGHDARTAATMNYGDYEHGYFIGSIAAGPRC